LLLPGTMYIALEQPAGIEVWVERGIHVVVIPLFTSIGRVVVIVERCCVNKTRQERQLGQDKGKHKQEKSVF